MENSLGTVDFSELIFEGKALPENENRICRQNFQVSKGHGVVTGAALAENAQRGSELKSKIPELGAFRLAAQKAILDLP